MGKFEIGIICMVLAFFFLILFFRQFRRRAMSDNTATSRIKNLKDKLPEGVVEIKGRVICDRPLTSRLSGIECVYFNYHLQDYGTNTSVLKNRTGPGFKTETSLSSSTSGSGEMWSDFQVQDSTGTIKVYGRGAEVQGKVTYNGLYSGPTDDLSETSRKANTLNRSMNKTFKGGLGEIMANAIGPQQAGGMLLATKVAEEIIPVGSQIYILAKITEVRGERVIMRDDAGSVFLISTLSEEELVNKISRWMWGYLMLCLLAMMTGLAFLFPFLKK